MKHFPVHYQNVYSQQIFQGGDMLRRALTNQYAWQHVGLALWGYVANKIHISINRRCINSTLSKVLT